MTCMSVTPWTCTRCASKLGVFVLFLFSIVYLFTKENEFFRPFRPVPLRAEGPLPRPRRGAPPRPRRRRGRDEYSALKTATASPKPPVYRPQAPNPGPQWDGGCPEDDAPRRPSNPPVTHPRSKFKPKLPTRAHPRYVEIRKAWDEAYEESLHEATSLKAFLCADNNCEACWKYFSCPP